MPLALRNIILPWWIPELEHMLRSLNMVHFHLRITSRAHPLQIDFLLSMVWPLDNFDGPLEFHGHGSWSLYIVALRQLLPPTPLRAFRGRSIGRNSRFFEPDRKIIARPARLQKKHCLCILDGSLSTNPMLSALHLPCPKSNIYMCTYA